MLTIGFVGTDNANFYGLEYEVYQKSLRELEALSAGLNFRLVPGIALMQTGADAARERSYLAQQGIDFLLVQTSALGDGSCIAELAGGGWPIGLWAVPEPTRGGDIKLHGLVTMNMYAGILTNCFDRDKVRYTWFYGHATAESFQRPFTATIRALAALKNLRNANLALIGGTAPGFLNLAPDYEKLYGTLGLSVQEIPFAAVVERAALLTQDQVTGALEHLVQPGDQVEVSDQMLRRGAAAYGALARMAAEEGFDGMAIACWPDFQEHFGIAPCAVFNTLSNRDGVCVSCEGDVGAVATALILRGITGRMPVTLDLTDLDLENDRILLWHCGLGDRSLAAPHTPVRLVHHPMMNRKSGVRPGVSHDFVFKEMPVTVCRLCRNGTEMFFFTGYISADQGPSFDGTRAFISDMHCKGRRLSAMDLLSTVMEAGVEHHLVLVEGACSEALERVAHFTGSRQIPFQFGPERG